MKIGNFELTVICLWMAELKCCGLEYYLCFALVDYGLLS